MRGFLLFCALIAVGVVAAVLGTHSTETIKPTEPPRFDEVPAWGVQRGAEFWRARTPTLSAVMEDTHSRFENRGDYPPLSAGNGYQSSLTDDGLALQLSTPRDDPEVEWKKLSAIRPNTLLRRPCSPRDILAAAQEGFKAAPVRLRRGRPRAAR